ncbi:fibronectin type III domain-containing protein, partial [Sedimenticola hydrogenitrophicus]|uniref:fibronectin type III domain-containing protein n=1 Tax=Sedimenticola hydrogenitrophicus TaxID=2967975 RepID=UPI0023B1CDCE
MNIATSVIRISAEGVVASALDRFNVIFINTIDQSSFTVDDVVLTRAGQGIPVSEITKISDVEYQVVLSSSLGDGVYDLTIGPNILAENGLGMDQDDDGVAGEAQDDRYQTQFTVDTLAPAALSVDAALAPVVHASSTRLIMLTGNRESDTAVWVNGVQQVSRGSGAWSFSQTVAEGMNSLLLTARDAAGNASLPVEVLYNVDSVAPVVTGIVPAPNSYLKVVPATLDVTVVETGSGVDVAGSTLFVSRGATMIPGSWLLNGNVLHFAPDVAFIEGVYQLRGKVRDLGGLESSEASVLFVIDQTPPAAPVVDSLPATTTVNQHTITGSKEPNSALWLNGVEVVGHTQSSSWSHTVALAEGPNTLSFIARDRAGNDSLPTAVSIAFDNTAPGPVMPLVSNVGNGTSVAVDWSGYDVVANGNDIVGYRLYRSTSTYTDIGNATLVTSVNANQKQYQLDGLTRGATYYLSVVAYDTMGNANSSVTPVSVTLVDQQPPPDLTGVSVEAFADRLEVSWTAPVSSDLAGYRLYFNGDGGTDLGATVLTHVISGLTAATGYPIRITTRDNDGNESSGVELTGVTW